MLLDILVNLIRSAKTFNTDEPPSGGYGSIQNQRKNKDRRSCTNPNLSGYSRRITIAERRGQTKEGGLVLYLVD
jgi:hypothetical protein